MMCNTFLQKSLNIGLSRACGGAFLAAVGSFQRVNGLGGWWVPFLVHSGNFFPWGLFGLVNKYI